MTFNLIALFSGLAASSLQSDAALTFAEGAVGALQSYAALTTPAPAVRRRLAQTGYSQVNRMAWHCNGGCIDGKKSYATQAIAINKCNAIGAGCAGVMCWTDSRWYVRKSKDTKQRRPTNDAILYVKNRSIDWHNNCSRHVECKSNRCTVNCGVRVGLCC